MRKLWLNFFLAGKNFGLKKLRFKKASALPPPRNWNNEPHPSRREIEICFSNSGISRGEREIMFKISKNRELIEKWNFNSPARERKMDNLTKFVVYIQYIIIFPFPCSWGVPLEANDDIEHHDLLSRRSLRLDLFAEELKRLLVILSPVYLFIC